MFLDVHDPSHVVLHRWIITMSSFSLSGYPRIDGRIIFNNSEKSRHSPPVVSLFLIRRSIAIRPCFGLTQRLVINVVLWRRRWTRWYLGIDHLMRRLRSYSLKSLLINHVDCFIASNRRYRIVLMTKFLGLNFGFI